MIFICTCSHSGVLPAEATSQVLDAVRASGAGYCAVPDLCQLAASRDPRLAALGAEPSVCIIACHPRAVRWLLAAGGCTLPADRIRVLDLRAQNAETVLQQLGLAPAKPAQPSAPAAAEAPPAWMPWFPVIDYDRCRQCRQCLNFCLFGVYGESEDGRVEVRQPRNCKTNCPACARICPEAAIVFPKCPDAPINGDEIRDEQGVRAAMRVDVERILGADPYAALAERKKRAERRLLRDPL